MGDLQGFISEANKYQSEIEEMHVKLQYIQVQIKMMEDGTEFLNEKKDILEDTKR